MSTGNRPTHNNLTDLALRYCDERRRLRTLDVVSVGDYRGVLLHFIKHVGPRRAPGRVTAAHIEAWLMGEERAPSTIRKNLSAVRGWFSWMVERKIVRANPAARIRPPREPRRLPRGLSVEQVGATFSHCADSRAMLCVSLEVELGLRRIEVARLQYGDIDRTERTLLVVGKGGHERVLPITAEAWSALVRYWADFPPVAGPLVRSFTNPRRGVQPAVIGRLVSAAMREAGVPATGHALRHTAAGDVLRGGANIRDVQAMLGHKTIVSTQRYLPLVVGDLRVAMEGRSYRTALPS